MDGLREPLAPRRWLAGWGAALIALCAGCDGPGSGSGPAASGASTAATPPPGCGAPANRAWDSDGDAVSDSVCVSDFDVDGALEVDDVQDAVASLAAAGRRTIIVLPGVYRSAADPSARAGRTHGLVELSDYTSLRCQSGAVLRAPQAATTATNFAVVSNADHSAGNRNIVINGCEIDGGAPDAYVGPVQHQTRMGVFLRRTRNTLVESNHVHHTYHSGLYTSNSVGDVFRGNLVEHVGGHGNQAPWLTRNRYPCIYAYSFGGEDVVDFVAENNDLRRCTSNGLNTRAEHLDGSGDAIRNLRWTGNRITDTGFATGDGGFYRANGTSCMGIRGVDGAWIADNECHSAGVVWFHRGVNYRSTGDDNANSNVTLERLIVRDADAIGGVWIGPYQDGLTLRDVDVRGTRLDDGSPADLSCLVIEAPLRNTLLERVQLSECGRIGLEQANLSPSGVDPSEALTIRDLVIDGTDLFSPFDAVLRPGIRSEARHTGLLLERVTVRGTTGPGVELLGALDASTLRHLSVDGVEPGWLGSFSEVGAPLCDATNEGRWITTTDANASQDCDFGSGGGSATARCGCRNQAWVPLATAPHAGIVLAPGGQTSSGVAIEDTVVSNARGATGVRLSGGISAFTVTRLVGSDTSTATDPDQRSAIEIPSPQADVVLVDVQCQGTDASLPCVEYAGP